MFKRIIAILAAAVFVLAATPLSLAKNFAEKAAAPATRYATPSGYNDHDYQKLVTLLEKKDNKGVKLGKRLSSDYDPSDPNTWGFYFSWRGENGLKLYKVDAEEDFDYNDGGIIVPGTLDLSGCTGLVSFKLNYIWMDAIDLSGCTSMTTALYTVTDMATSADLSGCTALKKVNLIGNKLTSVDLTGCPALTEALLNQNKLTSVTFTDPSKVKTLDLSSNCFTSIDLSGFSALTDLDMSYNPIKTLDLSGLAALKTLNCSNTALTSLKLTGCSELTELSCVQGKLKQLDLSGLSKLQSAYCYENQLTKITVSNCSALREIACGDNAIASLNLQNCSKLSDLSCENNALELLTLPSGLCYLCCSNNKLASLDLSNCKSSLTSLNCQNNLLAELDVSGMTALEYLYCGGNALTELDLDGLNLYDLHCENNSLSSLDITGMENLNDLNISYNDFDSIDFLNGRTFSCLYCAGLGLEEFDFSKIPVTWIMDCSDNPLGTLAPSNGGRELGMLVCTNAGLTSIDLTGCASLEHLDLDSNQLTSIEFPNCEALYYLSCYNNKLTSLDVSGLKWLETLYCSKNKLTELDVSSCEYLQTLGCKDNKIKDFDFTENQNMKVKRLTASGNGTIGYSQKYDYVLVDDEWVSIATVTLYAYPSTGYVFYGWYSGSTLVSAKEKYTLPEGKTYSKLTAKFGKPMGVPEITLSTVEATGKTKVSWAAVDGAAKYEVWRSTEKDGTYSRMKTTTALEYTNTSASAGTKYWYKVRCVAADGSEGNFCSPKYRICKLAQPVVKGGHAADTGYNKLTWDAVDGAVKYEVWRAKSKTGTYSKMITTTKTEYVNTSAEAGKTYYYKVIAVHTNTSANSAESAVKALTCDLPRPVVSIKLYNKKPQISWSAIDGAVKYEIWRRAGTSGSYTKIKTTTSTRFTNTGAAAGTKYYYKVIAVHSNTAANSAYSAVKSITSK